MQKTYKLAVNETNELTVTIPSLMKDIEESLKLMVEIPTDELSADNLHLLNMKILGIKTVHQFLGALVQEHTLANMRQELNGRINIEVGKMQEMCSTGTVQ